MSLLSSLKRVLPAKFGGWLMVVSEWPPLRKAVIRWEFVRDGRRFAAYSSLVESASPQLRGIGLESQLTRDYHRIEKGLALPNPKRPFGETSFLNRLNALIPLGETTASDAAYVRAAVSARDALALWNSTGTIDDAVAPIAPTWRPEDSTDISELFTSRRSVRNFEPGPVDLAGVYRAIELATYSPSVCNRQPWKVRLFSGDDIIKMLKHQSGNRGFTENIPLLALISVEIGYFIGRRERNQAWIDGGIFASTLVWALQALGFNSCMLNLSITFKTADRLRKDSGMLSSELPIMMMAIGRGAPSHRAARSVRRSLDEIVVNKSDLRLGEASNGHDEH